MNPADPFLETAAGKDEKSINISAFRLLYIYKLLSRHIEISVQDLNTHLLNHTLIGRALTDETLNKYIHTLRIFGCTIHRFDVQGQPYYRLETHPLKPVLSVSEMNALKNISEGLVHQPIASQYTHFFKLIQMLSTPPQTPETWMLSTFELALQSGLSQQDYAQVEQFQKYCFEGQVLEIRVRHEGHTVFKRVEPHQVRYDKNCLYLVGKDSQTHKRVRYPLDDILTHRQLPNRVQSQPVKMTVSFKLTGRVAASYRPYPGEVITPKGEFILVNHYTDEVVLLLKRLLKYGPHCQVISPDSARKEMRLMIEHLLEKTRESTESLTQALINIEQTDETRHKWACYLDSPQTTDAEADDLHHNRP